ncbi:MAG: lytic transglycosylase domain-containing protein [Candidatus Thiodiazotropha sp. (ex Lucinoma borealis)]|nr:lytic transglycosylase domain-containing protein [Candidatus Thiodiazotropha sp. (ex Lucinoma borealis)]MCU7865413.1 lytic transglycosylase domain-containing protein [Candidatus Thiodiazotropha sp. (ex Lucinoma borealis)]
MNGMRAILLLLIFPLSAQAVVSRADLEQAATNLAQRHQIPVSLMQALIQVESNWKTDAVSRAGAIGLMQLMPGTAARFNVDPYDPLQNLSGGARYLSWLIQRYNRLDLALAAYNAGEGAVDRHGDIPPYPETQRYVQKVLGLYGQSTALVRSVHRIRGYHLMRAF